MQETDQREFAKLLTGVASYYERTLATAVIDVYWNALREYDLEAVRRAMTLHAQNPDSGQWMPKVADVVRMLSGRTSDQAALAWAKVDAVVRRVGVYADVVFDDALIHRVVVDMGGWMVLTCQDDEAWPHVAREFENRYRGYRMRGDRPDYPKVLVGIANAHNEAAGFKSQPPVLVGDQAQAQRVLAGGNAQLAIGVAAAATRLPALIGEAA